jgi:hypothetical protein
MKFALVAAVAATTSLLAAAQSQPSVLFRIELANAQGIVDCPVMSGPIGQSFTTRLANGMAFSGRTSLLDADGVSTITVHFPSGAKPMSMTAKLEQQKPSFQTSVGGTDLRLTVVIESPELLATTQGRPPSRTFRGGSGPAFRRLDTPPTCEPLLRRPGPAS